MKNYLIYGLDQFLINQEVKRRSKSDSVVRFDMNETTIDLVVDEAAMFSMFTSEKVIICSNLNLDMLASDRLISYLNNPNESTTIIFISNIEKIDNKKKQVKEALALLKLCEVKNYSQLEISKYVVEAFKKNNYRIDNLTTSALISRVGESIDYLNNEIDKLKLYKIHDKVITKQDVEELCSKNSEDNIFELINMAVNRNKNAIFEIYEDLILKGEEPIKIIVSLANQFRLIYQVKYLISLKKSEEEIAKYLAIHPYRVKLAREKSLNFKRLELLKIIHSLADLDIKIKTGTIDKNLGLELFLLNL